ncbi:MAG TPA: STAS domain-containing protein [Opitutales bacterium]|nr:STAS domain-containing protein [Opitutales bacterium]
MTEQPTTFLVDAYSDPVIVKISGRASFVNSASLRDFFNHMIKAGKRRFILDFADCISMDSTFLGVIAGAALTLQGDESPGSMVLCRLCSRNLELVKNLGLDRLVTVDDGDVPPPDIAASAEKLETSSGEAELESAKLVLEAHKNLIEVDEGNREKFQDVVTFLKNQVDRM